MGVVVAVFFASAEMAQSVLNDAYGVLLGVAVIAGGPIQRAAERAALRRASGPGVPAAASPKPTSTIVAYRRAVRLAYKGRRFTAAEELELAHLAHDLGLSALDATKIRHEVEAGKGGQEKPAENSAVISGKTREHRLPATTRIGHANPFLD